jgi:hypothetical protein
MGTSRHHTITSPQRGVNAIDSQHSPRARG